MIRIGSSRNLERLAQSLRTQMLETAAECTPAAIRHVDEPPLSVAAIDRRATFWSSWHSDRRERLGIAKNVEAYLTSQPKQKDLRRLHVATLIAFPDCRLWFNDGTDAHGKSVSDPSIGYGQYTIAQGNGSSREFYLPGDASELAWA